MCGRYSFLAPAEAVRNLFKFNGTTPNFPPRYNIAPTQPAPVVILSNDGERELILMRWGLVPAWSKGPDSRFSMFNARAETVAKKSAYRVAFQKRRCLVPVDGFYEWKTNGGAKQPYRISLIDGSVFAFAGLWEHWEDGTGSIIESFTVITTSANSLISPIHDRMPVILPPEAHSQWLAGSKSEGLLAPYSATEMKAYPVDPYVNDARHDDAKCLAPAPNAVHHDVLN